MALPDALEISSVWSRSCPQSETPLLSVHAPAFGGFRSSLIEKAHKIQERLAQPPDGERQLPLKGEACPRIPTVLRPGVVTAACKQGCHLPFLGGTAWVPLSGRPLEVLWREWSQ